MEYVAVGLIVLISALTGVWAYTTVGTLQKVNELQETEEDDPVEVTEKVAGKDDFAAAFLQTAKGLLPKRWVLIAISVCLIGLAAAKVLVLSPGGVTGMKLAAAAVLLMPTMIIDWNTRTIPNVLVTAMLAVGAVFYGMQFFADSEGFKAAILGGVIGLVGCLIVFYTMSRLTKDGMGMGDVKQLAALGWMVGIRVTLASALLALFACTVLAVVLLVGKKKKASDSVPFGPFIFFGYLLALLIFNF